MYTCACTGIGMCVGLRSAFFTSLHCKLVAESLLEIFFSLLVAVISCFGRGHASTVI